MAIFCRIYRNGVVLKIHWLRRPHALTALSAYVSTRS